MRVDRGLELGPPLGLVTAELGLDPGPEHPRAEGLGDVVVGTPLEAGDHVALLALGGEHDDRHVASLGVALQPAAYLEAVHGRQHEVEHDEIRGLPPCRLEGVFTGGDALDLVALLREVVADQFEQIFLVIDDEDPLHVLFGTGLRPGGQLLHRFTGGRNEQPFHSIPAPTASRKCSICVRDDCGSPEPQIPRLAPRGLYGKAIPRLAPRGLYGKVA